MPKGVLVATPHATFGELLRLSLEESGRYVVRTVTTAQEVLANGYRNGIELVILDSDLSDASVVEVGTRLRQKNPALCLVVIPPENNPRHPKLAGFIADGYLSRPFYTPVLLEMLDALLESVDSMTPRSNFSLLPSDPSDQLPWLQNTNLATQFLASLLLETSAHAALLMRNDEILTHAGHLSFESIQEASQVLARYWSKTAQRELARFLRVADGEYLLYAVPVLGNVMLGMLFDTTMRLTQARGQSLRLAHTLVTEPPEEMAQPALQPVVEPVTTGAPAVVEEQTPGETKPFLPEEETAEVSSFAPEEAAPVFEPPILQTKETLESPLRTLRRLLQSEESQVAIGDFEQTLPQPITMEQPEEQRLDAVFAENEEVQSFELPAEAALLLTEKVFEAGETPAELSEVSVPDEGEWTFERIEPEIQKPAFEELRDLGWGELGGQPEEQPTVPKETEERAESEQLSEDLPETAILSPLELEEESTVEMPLTSDFGSASSMPQPSTLVDMGESGETRSGKELVEGDEGFSEADVQRILDMLAEMPSPEPQRSQQEEMDQSSGGWEFPVSEITFPWEDTAANPISAPDLAATLPVTIAGLPPESVEITRAIGVTRPVLRARDASKDTIPVGTHPSGRSDLPPVLKREEPVLLYTCVLVPQPRKFPLTGKLAQLLVQWMAEICQSFGWQLENVSVYAQYLLWTVRLTPNISPGNVVRLIRQYTSQRIFNQFPNVQQLVSGYDFWAPGYLIVRGSQPPAINVLTEFIDTAHRRQGK